LQFLPGEAAKQRSSEAGFEKKNRYKDPCLDGILIIIRGLVLFMVSIAFMDLFAEFMGFIYLAFFYCSN